MTRKLLGLWTRRRHEIQAPANENEQGRTCLPTTIPKRLSGILFRKKHAPIGIARMGNDSLESQQAFRSKTVDNATKTKTEELNFRLVEDIYTGGCMLPSKDKNDFKPPTQKYLPQSYSKVPLIPRTHSQRTSETSMVSKIRERASPPFSNKATRRNAAVSDVPRLTTKVFPSEAYRQPREQHQELRKELGVTKVVEDAMTQYCIREGTMRRKECPNVNAEDKLYTPISGTPDRTLRRSPLSDLTTDDAYVFHEDLLAEDYNNDKPFDGVIGDYQNVVDGRKRSAASADGCHSSGSSLWELIQALDGSDVRSKKNNANQINDELKKLLVEQYRVLREIEFPNGPQQRKGAIAVGLPVDELVDGGLTKSLTRAARPDLLSFRSKSSLSSSAGSLMDCSASYRHRRY